jgi:hypothetical protein
LARCAKLESLDISNNPISQKTGQQGEEEAAATTADEYVGKVREVVP